MMPYMILKHFGHEAIDTADVRKQHKNIRAIVLCSKRTFDDERKMHVSNSDLAGCLV